MSALVRRRQRDSNIWPGFVDALATLLMVVIFILMIFVVAQFYLTRLLSGKDESLARLTRQVAELSELLSLERETSAELRITVAQLSAELQTSISAREELRSQVGQLTAARDSLEGRLAEMLASRAVLQQRLDESEAARKGIDARLLEVLEERDALLGKLRSVEDDAGIAEAERAQSAAELEQAIKVIAANRETIELQLKDLERLRRDISALRDTRQGLEDEIAALVQARDRLQDQYDNADDARREAERRVVLLIGEVNAAAARIRTLTETNAETLARIAELTEKLTASDKRVVNLQTELEKQQAAASRLRTELDKQQAAASLLQTDLTDSRTDAERMRAELEAERSRSQSQRDQLGELRDTTKKLEARLSDQTERTQLAQTEIEQRDIRLEELFSEHQLTQEKLTEEKKVSAEAQQQVELLNAQIAALRQQLARIAAVLEATEAKNRDQNVQILDLGKRLNAALATKVQELARFRSEFFGRLREVLSNRDDVKIVGDRFVFQSEVLFTSGSAQIGEPGKEKLAQFAATLREISQRIPKEINWILQVEGHTDTVPIRNEQFRSNWELSAGRAISVVKFLVEQGIPADRLSATGYGENQPIDPQDLERNRRIEMKLTQR